VAEVPHPGAAPDASRPQDFVTRVFGSRWFARLWSAQAVSSLGDWLGLIAITAIAVRVGGGSGSTAVGLVLSARVVPGLFLGQIAGVLADRLDRKRTMVFCDCGRGVVLAMLPFVRDVVGLILASLVIEVLTLLWASAKEATVPNMVSREFLPHANSLSLAAAYGSFPVSSAAFALLVWMGEQLGHIHALHALAVGPERLALWFDVGTFFLSALTITTLAIPRRHPTHRHGDGAAARDGSTDVVGLETVSAEDQAWGGLTGALRDMRDGWHYIAESPVVKAVILGLACGLGGGGVVVPLGPVFSKQVLHKGSGGFGVLLTALGIGVAIGIIGLTVIEKRVPHRRLFVQALVLAGASLVAAASFAQLALSALCIVGLGLCAGAVYVLGFSMLQEAVDDEHRGRIFATLYTSTRLSLFLALIVAPFLTTLFDGLSKAVVNRRVGIGTLTLHLPGVRLTLWLGGVVIIVASWLALRALRQAGRVGTAVAPPAPDGMIAEAPGAGGPAGNGGSVADVAPEPSPAPPDAPPATKPASGDASG
jgi:dTMP kinase